MLLEPGAWRLGDTSDDELLLRAMLDVEVAWVRVQAGLGLVTDDLVGPVAAAADVARFDVSALAREGEVGGNPVLPVVRALRSEVGRESPEAAAVVHRGLTSQDVLDTAVSLVAKGRLATIGEELGVAVEACAGLASAHRDAVMVARTLGQPALPTTFGLKAAGWLSALDEAAIFVDAARELAPVQCGGAAGTLAAIDALAPGRALEAAARLADELGLARAEHPWHTERFAVTRLGDIVVGASDAMGKIAADVVVLSRSEIGEVREPAGDGRGASSTLPHKRNPVLSVLIRSVAIEAPHLGAALHSAAALAVDERPDGAWHAEWVPLLTLLRRVATAASQLAELLTGLHVDPEAMRRNVEAVGPALVAERLLSEAPGLARESGADPEALVTTLRGLLRDGAARSEVRAALCGTLDAAVVDDARLDHLLDPAAYVGVAGELVDRALRRHRSLTEEGVQ